jgi:hypothetical protein
VRLGLVLAFVLLDVNSVATPSCLVLAGNTTILCCPTDSTCVTIQPINCDITQQNNINFPENALNTTALDGILLGCESKCCPFGFKCNSGGNCVMDLD